jgi:hypothetical protein
MSMAMVTMENVNKTVVAAAAAIFVAAIVDEEVYEDIGVVR